MKTEKSKNENQQKANLEAHLALAADRPAEPEVCLDDDVFARFLEMSPGSEKHQEVLDHLSVCDACYQKWLSVTEILDKASEKQAARSRKRSLLTAAGSACALAVGVMLYLSIDYHPLVQTDLKKSSETVLETISSGADQVGKMEAGTGFDALPGPPQAPQQAAAPAEREMQFTAKSKRGADEVMMESQADIQDLEERAELSDKATAAPLSEDVDTAVEPRATSLSRPKVGDKPVRLENITFSAVLGMQEGRQDVVAPFIERFVAVCSEYQKNNLDGSLQQPAVDALIEQGRVLLGNTDLPPDERAVITEISKALEPDQISNKAEFLEACSRAKIFGRSRGYDVNNGSAQ